MGTAELLLALDAGQTRLQAVLVSAGAEDEAITSHLRLGVDRDHVSAGAFITEDGEVLFGDEAERRGAAQPERLVRDFLSRVGDRAPVVVGGFAVPAEELVTRMVRWALAVVAEQYGAIPGCIAVTHPTGWRGHRIKTLRAALQDAALGDVLLVPAAYAAARHAAQVGPSRAVAVYDLGGETFEASVLDGGRLAGTPCTLALGARDLDLALLQHVIAMAGDGALRDGGEMSASRRSVAAAKETLSQRSDAAVALRADGREVQVRLTRAELEDVAQPLIERTVDALENALDEAGVAAERLGEIVLVGGGSRLPLVAQTLSRRVDRPLTVPDEPQFATALGAGLLAWERTAERRRARAVAPAETALPERVPPLAALLGAIRSVRIPYGAATAVVAAGVIIAAGTVFGASTPMNESISAAARDEGADAGGDVGIERKSSWTSVTSPKSAEAGDARRNADAEADGVADDDGKAGRERAVDDASRDVDEPAAPAGRRGFQAAPADGSRAAATSPAAVRAPRPAMTQPSTPSGQTSASDQMPSGQTSTEQTGAADADGSTSGELDPPAAELPEAPSPDAQPADDPTPQPSSPDSQPSDDPTPDPVPGPTPEPTAEEDPAPTSEPDGASAPESTPEPDSAPTPEPAAPAPESTTIAAESPADAA